MSHSRRPKLGQHFLIDERIRRRIAGGLNIRPDELVIEIGPGRGAMTGLLAERARRVVAIEIDGALVEKLRDRLANESKIEIVQSDILATNLFEICRRAKVDRCFVFGNLPYNITSPILHHLLSSRQAIRAMALMVQHEVASRLVAAPGTRDYGYLTVFSQLHSVPRLVLKIPPGAFSPRPKVDSALVAFEMRDQLAGWKDGELADFTKFIKQCFGHKRKTLTNNLAGLYGRRRAEDALAALGIAPNLRAEQITIERLAEVFRELRSSAESCEKSSET